MNSTRCKRDFQDHQKMPNVGQSESEKQTNHSVFSKLRQFNILLKKWSTQIFHRKLTLIIVVNQQIQSVISHCETWHWFTHGQLRWRTIKWGNDCWKQIWTLNRCWVLNHFISFGLWYTVHYVSHISLQHKNSIERKGKGPKVQRKAHRLQRLFVCGIYVNA